MGWILIHEPGGFVMATAHISHPKPSIFVLLRLFVGLNRYRAEKRIMCEAFDCELRQARHSRLTPLAPTPPLRIRELIPSRVVHCLLKLSRVAAGVALLAGATFAADTLQPPAA